ncbi:uncharacterized protein LOC126997850 [Eriocheir sinensis]|uniref:uncharacterized protein LOC126997850 n=1 Tax=Eriocheir sinensis TaxID=95602 RepID=UPI0021C7B7CF|nr:uncharacterized protein LOC126997850 [Eriocheir sinensis]
MRQKTEVKVTPDIRDAGLGACVEQAGRLVLAPPVSQGGSGSNAVLHRWICGVCLRIPSVIEGEDGDEKSIGVFQGPLSTVDAVDGTPEHLPCLAAHSRPGDAPVLVVWCRDGSRRHLKGVIKGTRFEDVDDIKKAVMTELRRIPEESFQECMQAWQRRIGKCVRLQGDYFQGENL